MTPYEAPDIHQPGTDTYCPVEGVHPHAFRGPHHFREWDPDATRPDAPGDLDAETLAEAICNAEAIRHPGTPGWGYFSEEARDLFRREAAPLAAEYRRLREARS